MGRKLCYPRRCDERVPTSWGLHALVIVPRSLLPPHADHISVLIAEPGLEVYWGLLRAWCCRLEHRAPQLGSPSFREGLRPLILFVPLASSLSSAPQCGPFSSSAASFQRPLQWPLTSGRVEKSIRVLRGKVGVLTLSLVPHLQSAGSATPPSVLWSFQS